MPLFASLPELPSTASPDDFLAELSTTMTANLQSEISTCEPPVTVRPKARKSTVFVEVKRFIIVGFVNTVLDLAVLNLLIFLTHRGRNGVWFTLFKSVSFLVAVANSYFINHSWTFNGRSGRTSVSQATQFLAVSLFGALINVSSASYVATFIPAIHGLEAYWPSIAALAGTACGLAFNFLGYKHLVFVEARAARGDETS